METNNYGPQGDRMRRRRNVNLDGDGDQLCSDQATHLGIKWGDAKNENYSDEIDSTENYDRVPLSNREKSLVAQDQEITIPFRVGNCEVSIGQLKAPMYSEESQKLTVYLDSDLIGVMKDLKKANLIPSCSWLVSEALKQYLITNGS